MDQGLTQRELADRVGVSSTQIARIESGRRPRKPKKSSLMRIRLWFLRGRRFSAYGTSATGHPMRVIYDPVGPDGIRVTTAYPIHRRDLDRIRQEAQL